jgi:nucleoside-diphosphate-sugar epimerase
MTDDHANKSSCVLVTGATGFVGRHLVSTLVDKGYRVVALQHQRELPLEVQGRCEHVLSGDICDPGVQYEALRNVEAVCHLSAYIPKRIDDLQEAALCYLINAKATLELATMASKRGVRRFVQFSAGNMYAPSDRPCIESDSLFPIEYATAYFASKLAAELYLANICKHTALEVVILRVGSPYGPGEPDWKAIPTFLRMAAQGQALRLVNGGDTTYNLVYIADVTDCAARAIESGPPGCYNVASGEHTSLWEMARAIVELYSEHKVPIHVEPATPGSFPGFAAMSIVKARQAWGFAPRSLSAGLREYRASLAKDGGRQ